MTNFEMITQSPEALADFLESLNIEAGEQAVWEENHLGDSALEWLNKQY